MHKKGGNDRIPVAEPAISLTAQLLEANRRLEEEIAERKRVQALLAKAHDELGVKVADRTAKLNQAKEAAEAANKAKDVFLANMSHEIRTPLTGIMGFIHLMMSSELSDQQRTQMNYIKLSCDYLLSLINDILDLSRIEAEQLQLEKTKFHLPTVVQSVVGALAPQNALKTIALNCLIDPNVPQDLIGDPTRLRQVLFNLIANAIKFTNAGEVRLHCGVKERLPGETTLQFSVTDTGIGLPREELDRIFKRFARADMHAKANYDGTGLGLSICKHLVELMGGKIWVESTPGSGSRFNFTVKLPVHQETLLPVPAPGGSRSMRITDEDASEVEPSRRQALTTLMAGDSTVRGHGQCALEILLVEDDWINRIMAANMLEKLGARVTTAENGACALSLMERHRFDMVFMDVKMPVINGIEATRQIRERQTNINCDIPIIAMTAHAMQGDSEAFIEAGMNDYLSKPIDPDILAAKLRAWHDRIKQHNQNPETEHRMTARR
jgi:signal transduction histidine kinase/FixJ family two-component response regulator